MSNNVLINMNAINIKDINKNNIKLGKIFNYGDNYQLINIYHNNIKPVIYTPTLYIPNGLINFNDEQKPLLELTLENEIFDNDISIFRKQLQQLEIDILEILLNQYPEFSKLFKKDNNKYNLDLVSIFKPTYLKSHLKLLIPINKTYSKCILTNKISSNISSKKKILFNWDIPTPTYGIALILIKNIWIKNGKYGINLFCYLLNVMPSHILDPPDFMGDMEINNKTVKINDLIKHIPEDENKKNKMTLGNHPEYSTYYKMKKMGIPIIAIQNRMKINGHQCELINFSEDILWIDAVNKIMMQNKEDSNNKNVKNPNVNTLMKQLKDINNIKLKKIDKEKINNENLFNIENKIPNQYRNMRVPSLSDINNALLKLKKIDKKIN